jgi:hypothetical protein
MVSHITSAVSVHPQHALAKRTSTFGDPDVVHADPEIVTLVVIDDDFFNGGQAAASVVKLENTAFRAG